MDFENGKRSVKCSFCDAAISRRSSKSGKYYCDTRCKAECQRLAKLLTKDELVRLYVNEKKDCVQIGAMVGRDPKSIWNWLKDFGIPTRSRGSEDTGSAAHHFRVGLPSRFKGKKHTASTRILLREIAVADGRVPFNRAIGPPLKGKRGEEVPTWKGGVTPERQAFYSTPEWKSAVKAVWKRDNATCQRCGLRKGSNRHVSFDIHHIVGFECVDLRAELSNLVLICEPCHYWVHSSENVDREFIKEICLVSA